MKVLVLYENNGEIFAATNLACNLDKIGAMLANATLSEDGTQLHINVGPPWNVSATAAPFETLPKPKPVLPKLPKGVRDLIFDEEE